MKKKQRVLKVSKMRLLSIFVMLVTINLSYIQATPRVVLYSEVTVSGTVTDAQGAPLEGVSIMLKGSNVGTSTDSDGHFVMANVSPESVLVFRSVGYKTQEITVGDNTTISVVLEDDIAGLDEVVVVGYGTMKKSDLTGAVQRVNASDFRDQGSVQLTDMLAGTVAGFQSNQGSTAEGGGSMLIRGENSINASTSPMVVLDGVIYNGSISDINPNDIETIDILKDASSAAVYGARAANGVILVTTKRGKTGKPVISFTTRQGLAQATSSDYAARDPQNYLNFRKDFFRTLWNNQPDYFYLNPNELPAGVSIEEWRNANNNPNPDNIDEWLRRLNLFPEEIESYYNNTPINWIDEALRTGHRQEYDISIGGATDNASYFWSVGYVNNEGVFLGDDHSNFRSRLNLDMTVNDWVKVGVNAQYAYRDRSSVLPNLGQLYQSSPFGKMYEDDGTINFYPHGYTTPNPLLNTLGQDRNRINQGLFASLYGELSLPFGIKYRLSFQPRSSVSRDYNFWSTETVVGRETYSNGYATRADVSSFEWMLDNLLTWNQKFGKHGFDVTLLYNAEQFKSWSSDIGNQSFQPSPALGFSGLQYGNNPFLSTEDIQYTGDGLMGRVNYNFDDRYLLTASVRRDGFSGFGQQNPYAVFPAAAFAWQLHNERFFNSDFINQLKLRVSWGKNGNREIGPYAAYAQMSSSLYYDGTNTQVGVFTSSLSNPQLSWEETQSLNFGADMTLFDNRFTMSLEYYDAETRRLLVNRSLPTITGFKEVTTNIGALGNKGFELTASSQNVRRSNFSWTTSFNFAFNRNRINSLFGDMGTYTLEGETYTGELPDFSNQWFVGKPLDVIWDYNILGVWQMEEAEQAGQYGLQPGDYKAEDLDGNLLFEALYDKQFIGYTQPRFRMGLRNEFRFLQHFSASVFLRADLGHMRNFAPSVADYSTYDRRSTANFDYWTPENRTNQYPRLGNNRSVFGGGLTPYHPTSFLRVQDVSLSYTLPVDAAQRMRLNGARLFVSGRNVYTVTKWPGWDPESGFNAMPKFYTIGVDLTL